MIHLCVAKVFKMDVINAVRQPWPWYVAGPLIGLTVPALLLPGNKSFGISSSLRHICAACMPIAGTWVYGKFREQLSH